jgi:NDP-sugar pyrophosphorylase family protein
MKGMILAAGFGTRFRPVTYTLPKPLVPLCNRPLIGWAVESFLDAGVYQLIVNLHHLPELLEQYLRERYAGIAEFHFSFEEQILGTGGGVRRVRPQLEMEIEFFLVNGDTVQFPRWDDLLAARGTSLAALTLRHPPAGDNFTAVFHEGGRVTGFGNGTGEPLMFSGSHLISTRIFEHLPEKDFSGIINEVYQPLLEARTDTIAAIVDDGLWFDIGTPQRYLSAMQGLLEAMANGDVEPPEGSALADHSLVASSAHGSGTRSTIGAQSVVRGTITDTAIWDGCVVPESATLERCIVAHGVMIPDGATFTNALICRDDIAIPQGTTYERRDGLVIAAI